MTTSNDFDDLSTPEIAGEYVQAIRAGNQSRAVEAFVAVAERLAERAESGIQTRRLQDTFDPFAVIDDMIRTAKRSKVWPEVQRVVGKLSTRGALDGEKELKRRAEWFGKLFAEKE